MVYKEDLANIIEGRILAEKRKHPTLDWIKIASLKIANDIIKVKENLTKHNNRTIQSVIPICPDCNQPTKTLVDCCCNCNYPKAD